MFYSILEFLEDTRLRNKRPSQGKGEITEWPKQDSRLERKVFL